MITADINTENRFQPLVQQLRQNQGLASESGKFTDTLNEFLGDVNSLQNKSKDLDERFIKGEPVELHDVMIASEKAKTSFQLLLEMRNKFVDMYRQILNMPV